MEGEIWNISKILIIVSVSLTYCYIISIRIPKGITRLLFFLPIISIFLLLPLLLSYVFFQFYIGLFLGWYANFKLLLLALYQDDHFPMESSSSLFNFILFVSVPINIKHAPTNCVEGDNNLISPLIQLFINVVVFSFLVQPLFTKPSAVGKVLYAARISSSEQLVFDLFVVIAKPFVKYELAPPFVNPYMPTSVQNFWGKRWNLLSSSLLKSTIYIPTRSLLTPVLGRRGAMHSAIVVTFAVSGFMHEVFYIYVTRQSPTWEAVLFFIANGVWIVVEIELKKKASQTGWHLRPVVSTLLTNGFLLTTGIGSLLELMYSGADVRESEEYAALVVYVKSIIV